MLDPYKICLGSLHKFAGKILSKLNRWKRRKPKRMFSFAPNMEVSNQMKQVFEFFDANGDGKISPLELSQVLLSLGHEKSVAAKEAEGMVREMDRDGDGFVDMDEFMTVVRIDQRDGGFDQKEDDDHDLMDAFRIFDSDKNGFISAKELQRVLISLGCGNCSLGECREMIRGVDRDGDGLVDFDEFRSMMMITQ